MPRSHPMDILLSKSPQIFYPPASSYHLPELELLECTHLPSSLPSTLLLFIFLPSSCVLWSRIHLVRKRAESYPPTTKSRISIAGGKPNGYDLLATCFNNQAEELRPIKMPNALSNTIAAVGPVAQSSSTPDIIAPVTPKTLPTAFITSSTLASNTDLNS